VVVFTPSSSFSACRGCRCCCVFILRLFLISAKHSHSELRHKTETSLLPDCISVRCVCVFGCVVFGELEQR
jgi:hypothetical protein